MGSNSIKFSKVKSLKDNQLPGDKSLNIDRLDSVDTETGLLSEKQIKYTR